MNKLMEGVNLTQLTDIQDSESMVQYGGPVPEGETDAIEAKAIKEGPSHITSVKSKKNKGYIEF
jgi:hypothetical protein